MLISNDRHFRYAAAAILAAVLVLILCTFRHYGVTWDEELQSQYGLAIADYYTSFFKDQRYHEIFNLYLYGGLFDGLAAFVDRVSPFRIYDTRHLLNALFGLLGLWGVWRLGRFLGGGYAGLLALILCATTPMYYGHMFNNPKDIPFATGIIWTLYFMFRSYAKPSWPVTLKLGIVLGLTLGVRVGGVMIVAFWLLAMGIATLLPLLQRRDTQTIRAVMNDSVQKLRIVFPVILIAYAVMLMCWPWAQQNPIANPLRALSEFSNFPQNVEVLLDGKSYMSTELPWYYVPMYFGIQLPEFVLFLLVLSIFFMPMIWRQFTLPKKQSFALMLLMIVFPISYAAIRRPALYDAVRHFLFVVPLASVIAALTFCAGYKWCLSQFEKPHSRCLIAISLCVVFVLSIGTQIAIMTQLHPYEYIYANQFIGGVRGAYGRFESDYWGSSFKEAAERIQALVASEGGVPNGKIYRIAICGPWDSAMIYLPPDYEPVVANEPAEFFLSTTRWMCQDMRPGQEVIRVQRMGVPLSIVKDLRNGFEHYPGNEHENKK